VNGEGDVTGGDGGTTGAAFAGNTGENTVPQKGHCARSGNGNGDSSILSQCGQLTCMRIPQNGRNNVEFSMTAQAGERQGAPAGLGQPINR
jgi:hypothetical protein